MHRRVLMMREVAFSGLPSLNGQCAFTVEEIQVRTAPGEGCVFQIFLPAMPLQADNDIETADVISDGPKTQN